MPTRAPRKQLPQDTEGLASMCSSLAAQLAILLVSVAVAECEFLAEAPSGEAIATLRRHERTGRPLGSMSFIADLESQLRRVLRPQKPGCKRKAT